MKVSNYSIESNSDEVILIKDLGPWDRYKTVTNDAEAVVAHLFRRGLVTPNKQIIYIDSDGDYGELYHDGAGNFEGFGFTQAD